jgi:hypothetical protein
MYTNLTNSNYNQITDNIYISAFSSIDRKTIIFVITRVFSFFEKKRADSGQESDAPPLKWVQFTKYELVSNYFV